MTSDAKSSKIIHGELKTYAMDSCNAGMGRYKDRAICSQIFEPP